MNGIDATLRNVGWALLRMAVGVMFLTHGYAKVFGVTDTGDLKMVQFAASVANLGLPQPELMAWVAALSELVGGALIAIGLFTRPAALFAAGTMAVAVHSHGPQGYAGMEKALLFMVCHLAFLLGGAGPVSFDAVIKARKARASSAIFK